MSSGPSEGLKIRGCQYYLVGIICPPWLTDLPKFGEPPAPPGTIGLVLYEFAFESNVGDAFQRDGIM